MATIGELIDALKGKAPDSDTIRPEPTGTEPYEGVDGDGNPETGTYDPTVVIDQDDIPASVKEKVGSYLNARTSGQDDLRNRNVWPVEDTGGISDYRLWDDAGNPTGPTKKTTDGYGFTTDFETALGEAINVFESESAFFEDPTGLINKNIQEEGHSVLLDVAPLSGGRGDGAIADAINATLEEAHPAEREMTSGALQNNRFARGYTSPDAAFNTFKNTGEPGVQNYGNKSPINGSPDSVRGYTPDRPYISEDEMYQTYLNQNPMLNSGARWYSAPWKDLDNWSAQWDSIDGDGFDEWEEKYEYAQNLKAMLEKWNADTPDWWYIGKQSWLMALIIKVILELIAFAISGIIGGAASGMPSIQNTSKPIRPHNKEFGSSWKSKQDYSPPPPEMSALEKAAAAAAAALGLGDPGSEEDVIEKIMGILNLPIPHNTIREVSDSYDNLWAGIPTEFFTLVGEMLGNDETMINYWRPIMGHFISLMTDIEKWRPPEAPIIYIVDMVLYMFSQSPLIRFLRAMFNLLEAYFASGGRDGVASFSKVSSKVKNQYYGAWSHHPSARPFRSRTIHFDAEGTLSNEWYAAQSIAKLPSMYLLPGSLSRTSTIGSDGAVPYRAPSLLANKYSSPLAFKTIKESNRAYGEIDEGDAVSAKGGTPYDYGNRFDPEEVNFMENLLEAEHMPFYIQDLRTNEVVAFHAFLSSLSDSFSPSWKASSGFGRIEDVQVYEKTGRAISITFTMAAMGRTDLDELYWKLNKLTTLVYPQWSAGTMMQGVLADGEEVMFRQPFSQIPTASPIIRLRVGDLIKNNYSKLNMMNLFGAQEAEFMTGEASDQFEQNQLDAQMTATHQKILAGVKTMPVVSQEDGNYDGGKKGWPVGCTVLYRIHDTAKGRMPDETLAKSSGIAKSDRERCHLWEWNAGEIVEYIAVPTNYGADKDHQDICVKVKGSPAMKMLWADDDPISGWRKWTWNILDWEADKDNAILSYSEIDHDATMADPMLYAMNWPHLVNTFEVEEIEFDYSTPAEKAAVVFDPESNPYFKSFESSMGRGLAGIINSLSFNYKLNEAPWEIDPGSRGPTMIEVSIGFTPIHDIQPGLDSKGGNRAPVFPIGGSALGGDAWDATAARAPDDIKTFDQIKPALTMPGGKKRKE